MGRKLHAILPAGSAAPAAYPISEFHKSVSFRTRDGAYVLEQSPEGARAIDLSGQPDIPFNSLAGAVKKAQTLSDGRVVGLTLADDGAVGLVQLFGPKPEKKK